MSSIHRYAAIQRLLHWCSALIILGLFSLGLWMVDLDYYHPWYTQAPHYHRSLGVVLAMLTVIRLIARIICPPPAALPSHSLWLRRLSTGAHTLLYLLILLIVISGYLISTADHRGIAVFNWFVLPGLGEFIDQQEDIAGQLHYLLACSLIGLALLHGGAALKHHFIDKDTTLKRML